MVFNGRRAKSLNNPNTTAVATGNHARNTRLKCTAANGSNRARATAGSPRANAQKEMSGHRRAAKKNQERPGGEVDGDEVENHRHAR